MKHSTSLARKKEWKQNPEKARAWLLGSRIKNALKRCALKKRSRRYARMRDKQFGPKADFIKTQRCDTCGASAPSDPSHYPSRGAGGTAKDLFPQCRECHVRMHEQGVSTFLDGLGLTRLWLGRRIDLWELKWREVADGRICDEGGGPRQRRTHRHVDGQLN